MKKNLVLRAALMAALPLGLIVSCAKEVPQNEENATAVKAGPCVIIADIPESKVSLTPGDDGKGLGLAWEKKDKLRVISESAAATFAIDAIDGKKATFKGTAVEGSSFTVLYPGTYETEAAIKARRYDNQTQIGNAGTAHLEWNAKVSGLTDYSSVTFSGSNCLQNGALKFYFKMPADFTKVYSVSLSAPADIFSVDNGNSAQVRELTLSLKDNASTDGLTLGADKIFTAYMMVSWNNNAIAAGTDLTIKVKGDQEQPWTKVKTVGEGGFTIAGGKVTSLKLNDQNWDEPLFWAGSGTETDPYQIKTVKHLQNVKRAMSEQEGLYFKLIENIDLSGIVWGPLNAETTVKALHFDGNHHKISNMTVAKNGNPNYNSLFGYISGEVNDLTIENASITSGNNGSSSGILAGWFQDGTISNVDIIGTNTVTLANNIGEYTGCGGLVGIATGATIADCDIEGVTLQISGSVTPQNGGSLAGRIANRACIIERCSVKNGSVTAAYRSGGLIGSVGAATTITDCTVGGTGTDAVTVTTAGSIKTGGTGGLVGAGTATVTFSGSHFNGSVTGVALVGGLTGQISAKTTYDDCSSAGSVEATGSIADFVSNETASYAGGIAGAAKYSDVLTSCSSTADVTANQGIVGGLIGDAAGVTLGKSEDATKACHYRNGTVTASGGTDRMNSAVGGMIGIARSTAVKIYYGAIEGATVTGLRSVGGALGFNQVATASLNNITASNVTVSGSVENIGGLVGYLNYGAVLTSCKLEGTSKVEGPTVVGGILGLNNTGGGVINSCSTGDKTEVTSEGMYAGGIVGLQSSTNSAVRITSCKSSGAVTAKLNGASYAGGIVGYSKGGTVSKCYSSATVAGNQRNGGIIGGATSGAIEECAYEGTLNSGKFAGGILGNVSGSVSIANCYSAGTMSSLAPVTAGNESGGAGGIVGLSDGSTVLTVSNCYSKMTVKGGTTYARVGGIFGYRAAGSVSISNCLAWNELLDFSGVSVSNEANGVVTAQANATMSSNYRTSALVMGSTYKLNGTRVLEDNADGRDGMPYSGTCSAKASELGWDTSVWKLTSGDYPVLINVAK